MSDEFVINIANKYYIQSKIDASTQKNVINPLNRLISHWAGLNGKLINNYETVFYCNYFPNGNSIPTTEKLRIYQLIKENL
jgi:hypothetical protein